MSVESQTLERSALERKDRDELHTIAVALGGKPGSRARKADIVDLILELAGVTDDASSVTDDANGEAATGGNGATETKPRRRRATKKDAEGEPAAADADPVTADQSGDRIEPTAAAEPGTVESAEKAGEAEAVESAEATRSATARRSEPESAGTAESDEDGSETAGSTEDRTARGGRSSGEQRNREGRGRREGASTEQRDGGQQGRQGQGGQQQGGQQQGGQQQGGQGADAEPGNRRRRRRGRDRERGGGGGGERERERGGERPEEPWQGEPVEVTGLLDLRDEGYGFLRVKSYLASKDDVYVSVKQVRQFGLRRGDHIKGASRPAGRNEKNPALLRIDEVNGDDPEKAKARPRFEDLTPLFPDERLKLELESDPTDMTARIVDLISPIGKGQRGLIVSPPKAGKTTVMKQIARSIETNNPEVHLMVLLIDERPEEVTDMRRWVKGEVVASTFDRPSDEHTSVAELSIERAKRMVEEGRDVVVILDGITRLARAYNLAAPATGRIMSGGIDTGALYPPKKFFGAARNIEEGGSLTILATALIETGSKMDEVIFEEFKGTGNMELRLDRRMAERRIYPAIDVDASSTRHEELLFDRRQLQMAWKLRRVLSGLSEGGGGAGLEMLIDRLSTFKSNDEFLTEVAKAPSAGA
jgi:transcription termination factor Rho